MASDSSNEDYQKALEILDVMRRALETKKWIRPKYQYLLNHHTRPLLFERRYCGERSSYLTQMETALRPRTGLVPSS